MTTAARVPLETARTMAGELAVYLFEACRRIQIAGSIRRGVADVKDIDLVCIPMTAMATTDLFGEVEVEIDLLTERCDDLVEKGILAKRLNRLGLPSWGPSLKRAVYRDVGVDIQAVHDPDSWGAWMLIRTGPKEFNRAIVTPRHRGGLLPPGFEWRDGFKLHRAGGRVPTPTEESVFDALGLPYVAPEARR